MCTMVGRESRVLDQNIGVYGVLGLDYPAAVALAAMCNAAVLQRGREFLHRISNHCVPRCTHCGHKSVWLYKEFISECHAAPGRQVAAVAVACVRCGQCVQIVH